MYPIVETEALSSAAHKLVVSAPAIAKKVLPGQFIMLRIDEEGERIPLTVNDSDPEAGTITLIFQPVGATTMQLETMKAGEALLDVVGPLGNPTELEGATRACVIGGGLGAAIAYPQAKWLHEHGISVDVIVGFRSKDIIILEDEFKAVADNLIIMTDDGSNGNQGFVNLGLQKQIDAGVDYDLVLAIGPVIMMKTVAEVTRPLGIKTLVSLNPIMIDGTGMCGGCRVKVGGEYKHACVDGPDFDGHQVDYDEVMRRNRQFTTQEAQARDHVCKLGR